MTDKNSLRDRYNQFFVLILLCCFIYAMVQSIGPGATNFEDHFYKKGVLIEKVDLLRLKLGDRVFPVAVIGKNGWMEYSGQGTIEDIQHIRTFDNMEAFGKGLKILDQYLKSRGITLLIIVPPNKASIYPDTIADQLKSLPVPSRLDNLIIYLEDNNLPVLDLRPALRTARKDKDVYYKTDTHWNGYGALVAYQTIINTLKTSHPELTPYEAADLEYQTTGPDLREIPSMMGVTTMTELSLFFVPKEPFVQTLHPGDYNRYNQLSWIPNSTLPTLLMFHDSFGANYLNDYLSMNFSTSHFVHLESMSQYMTKEAIEEFNPDIIVIEIVERNLHELPIFYPSFMME